METVCLNLPTLAKKLKEGDAEAQELLSWIARGDKSLGLLAKSFASHFFLHPDPSSTHRIPLSILIAIDASRKVLEDNGLLPREKKPLATILNEYFGVKKKPLATILNEYFGVNWVGAAFPGDLPNQDTSAVGIQLTTEQSNELAKASCSVSFEEMLRLSDGIVEGHLLFSYATEIAVMFRKEQIDMDS